MPKYFSVAEAERTLPLVRRIISDITTLYPEWRDLVNRHELLSARSNPEWGESPEQLDLQRQIESVARKITDCHEELDRVGCVLKDPQLGLVDFYGKLDGRDIFWCWKHGEERIGHWHEIEAGFAGRRPLPTVVAERKT
ncbi:MAG TPA: DUF2203 domain-containing protein [Gemmatimonadales bacterium]|nr:DUF2203 domain-containing protein [Gemmatimonadales bacterium]